MGRISDLLFVRQHRVCPRWMCFTFDNWIRRCLQNPEQIIKDHIRPGDTVLDIGPGIGFFTIPMARLVGDEGQVVAVDIQPQMLAAIAKRASRAGVEKRIILHLAGSDSLNINVRADFVLAFWMAHEVPDQDKFFTQIHTALKEGGKFLLAEPKLHVSQKNFLDTLGAAGRAGLRLSDRPAIPLSLSALLTKN